MNTLQERIVKLFQHNIEHPGKSQFGTCRYWSRFYHSTYSRLLIYYMGQHCIRSHFEIIV